MADLALRKSSYSGGEEECVEVATNVPNTVAVRDSKDPEVGAGTSRALRGHLWLDGCGLNDIAVRRRCGRVRDPRRLGGLPAPGRGAQPREAGPRPGRRLLHLS
ncbi:hypothetical protein SSPO_035980 [Streptomyces antimycoticus]|uniref:DUF397 domain-containing protein n=1 Tax=Streptomyces antimycoticus TaxID=68175 RepID=A0A499UKH4_9ACTN|nr:hypothetical protein SSPO_035980 [Streptomyces antimycoticus]